MTKPSPKIKRRAVAAYRGLSVGAIIWLYATFPTKSTVKAQWNQISSLKAEVAALKVALEIEKATSIHIKNEN